VTESSRTPAQWRQDEARQAVEDDERIEERARFAEDVPRWSVDMESLRCLGCGAVFGSGCSCRENARAIGRGEAAKCQAEESWGD
jgi:hypothetical protein